MGRSFGTDGIRGEAGTELTENLARDVGLALAAACREGSVGQATERPTVILGRDTRPSGPSLAAALTEGLVAGGGQVADAGVIPTAGVAHLVAADGAAAGVMISASHNPPGDNGIKVIGPGGWKLPVEAERRIEELMAGAPTAPGGSSRTMDDGERRYIDHLVSSVATDLSGIRVTVDCANGAGFAVAPTVLRALGVDVTALFDSDDGTTINDGCGAMHPEVVAAHAARTGSIGMSLDGDADRVIMADEDGRVVDGDGIIALLAPRMNAHAVVVTVMANQALRRWCDHQGIELVETPVGDRFVLEAMRERRHPLGGEQSGHIVRLDRATTGDGILVALGVLELVAGSGRRLADLVPFQPMPQVMVNVRTEARDRAAASDGVRAAVAEGERRLNGNGRVLVRPSGTEPLVRVMVEAGDEDEASRVAELVAAAVDTELNGSA